MSLDLNVTEKLPECLVGHAGPLAICVWRGAPTVAALEAVARAEHALLARHDRISVLVVVRDHKGRRGRPDPALERLEAELADTFAPRSVGTAIVVESHGLSAAVVHGARARLLPRFTTPNEAFPRVVDALQWLARLPGQAPELYAAPGLACDLELLGRGDEA